MIKAVIFDIDGVLFDSQTANVKFYEGILKELGYKQPALKGFSFSMTMLDTLKLLTREKSSDKIKEVWDFANKYPYPYGLIRTPKDCSDSLRTLKKEFRLAIVTSRRKEGVEKVYGVLKLGRGFFDTIVAFGDFSKPKPDPESLLLACRRLRVKPVHAVYVGDTEADMKAARAAGMMFILYSKKPMKGALRTASFAGLRRLVAKLDAGE